MGPQRVAVAGANGTAGQAYVKALCDAGHEVIGTVRPGSDQTRLLEYGAAPVEVDLHDTAATQRALSGAGAVVIAVLGRGADPESDETDITRAVIAGSRAGAVEKVIYTSVHLADEPTGVPHFEVKGRLEQDLVHSGIPFTVLRPTTFMDGLTAPWLLDSALEHGTLVSPIDKDVAISYLATADLARLAVLALDEPRLDGATLPIGGPTAVTYTELLPLLSELAGRSIEYRQLPLEQLESS